MVGDADFRAVLQSLGSTPSTPAATAPPARTVAVLGAGAVGRALACEALAGGAEVRMHSVFGRELAELRAAGSITVRGAHLIGSYAVADAPVPRPHIRLVSSVDEAVSSADVILVATPATAHAAYAGLLADCVRPGQAIVLVPGRFLGSVAMRAAVADHRPVAGVVVAELGTVPYLVSSQGSSIAVHGVSRDVELAALPVAAAANITARLARMLPMVRPVSDPLVTTFGSVTGVLGVAPRLTNTALVESKAGTAMLLRDLVPAGLSRTLMRQLDEERREVAFHFGVRDLPSTARWLRASFGTAADQVEDDDIATALADLEVFDEVYLGGGEGPSIVDDVCHLLAPLADAGRKAGVATPATETVINLASCLVGRDLSATGRTLAGLGIGGIRPDGVRRELAKTDAVDQPASIYWSV